jgi:hypothetical protein
MHAGFLWNCRTRDSMTVSPQNAQGMELRILAGSGSATDVMVTESILTAEEFNIQLARALRSSLKSSGIPLPWKSTRTPFRVDRE